MFVTMAIIQYNTYIGRATATIENKTILVIMAEVNSQANFKPSKIDRDACVVQASPSVGS